MNQRDPAPFSDLDVDAALRAILEGTATETGTAFFTALVDHMARALHTEGAWVTEYEPEARRLNALAFRMGGRWIDGYAYDVTGTPCQTVVEQSTFVHVPENLFDLYPGNDDFRGAGAVSYMGAPLLETDGTVLGLVAVMDTRPMPAEPRAQALFRIFANRATAELQRLHREAQLKEREGKLRRLVAGAMDAIVELNGALRVTQVNPAAEKAFGVDADALVGADFAACLTPDGTRKLADLMAALDDRPEGEQALWIAGGLEARRADGDAFAAEATLSRTPTEGMPLYTLILRDVNERLAAERRIHSLTQEAAYLKEEIKALHNFDEIIGESPAMAGALEQVAQVAGTEAGVLILGETGTGKELFARAIHNAGPRRDKPLIKVNCAAIPATLMESEFFGHEKGAFTGATQRREGRFALADGGTLFLDEVGELPPDLQAKLLRVLQEGEFEPVGSGRTRKVDVRVIAATNRDLLAAAREGAFRKDLYYRLNVFPLPVPPLRERGHDVVLLAEAFARRFAQRLGRTVESLGPDAVARLTAYDWPGNVRELENVVERAVIVSPGPRLRLEDCLPAPAAGAPAPAPPADTPAGAVLTDAQVRALERDNLLRALDEAGWKVAGPHGAAHRLGLRPSTLASRMKALGITRPPGP